MVEMDQAAGCTIIRIRSGRLWKMGQAAHEK
jgi:hypothetical protein